MAEACDVFQKKRIGASARYRILFERNVAGIILTNTERRILDCNEPCARIFWCDSRDEMLTHSAWDFYLHRVEREALMNRLPIRGYCPTEKVSLRRKNGKPVWVLTSRTVASFAEGLPELLQGTVIDITAQEKAQACLREINASESTDGIPEAADARIADLSRGYRPCKVPAIHFGQTTSQRLREQRFENACSP